MPIRRTESGVLIYSSSLLNHDDDHHEGSAKRDAAGGITALDVNGNILAPGAYIFLARDVSDNIVIVERTSGEYPTLINRVGANDYIFKILAGGVHQLLQHAGDKGIANGIAGLDASAEITSRLAYEDVANGIAGLDASVKLLWDQLPLPMLTVAQFQANAGTGTAENPQKINDTSVAASVMFDVVGEYAQVSFPHPMWIHEYRHHGISGLAGDGRWKIQIYHDGAWIDNTVAIPLRNLESWSDWVALTIPVYTQGIRFVATTIDSTYGISSVRELEIRG